MSNDPLINVKLLRMRLENRLHEVIEELKALSDNPDAINSKAQISLSQDDIQQGWTQLVSAVEHFTERDSAVTHELMAGLGRLSDGLFVSGTLLTRDESASRRFGSKAPALARAARARKLSPLHRTQADIIATEVAAARSQNAALSPDKLAESISDAVNARLVECGLMRISKTTIWRRIRDFNL